MKRAWHRIFNPCVIQLQFVNNLVNQVTREVICDQALNQMLFQWISTHAGPHTWQNRINQWRWVFRVPWSPDFVIGLPSRVVFEYSPSDHETWSIWCYVGIHVDFTTILHSHTHSIDPSSVVWSELGAGSAFPTNESAWSAIVMGSQSHVWSGPKSPCANLNSSGYTSRKLCKKEPQSFSHCGSFDHLDM